MITTSSSSTSSTETLESLQSTLEPLAALQGQQSQLESWVNDSCQALEKLHGELAEWQNELARKQTELDLREDALDKCHVHEEELDSQVEQWKADLAGARQEAQQFSEENADQVEQLEQLEIRCIELETELKTAQQRGSELAVTLEAERARAAEEQVQWKEEFKGMRELLDKQCSLLATQIQSDGKIPTSNPASTVNAKASVRSKDLRRRAQERLAAKRKQRQDQQQGQASEESTES